jgi:serine/threonine-protein kinase
MGADRPPPQAERPEAARPDGSDTVVDKPATVPPRATTESPDTVAEPVAGAKRARAEIAPDAPETSRTLPMATSPSQVAAGSTERTEPEWIAVRAAPVRSPVAGSGVHPGSSISLTTTAEALRHEEIRRIRHFIALGWLLSIATMGLVPLLDTPRWMDIAFIGALVWGIVASLYFHQRFADPRRYSVAQMATLAVIATINMHVAIFYFGAFTTTPVIMVVGIHFLARSESEQAARALFATAMTCFAAGAAVIAAGWVDDPGAFAAARELSRSTLAAGALFVLGMYALAYYTGRAMRRASVTSMEGFRRQTRLAAQRQALMDELRADLERALRVGGPGRYSDQIVGSFKLGMVLGRGAMGEVYEAVHTTTGEPAAVKLLRREMLADPTHVARFLREVKTSGGLASPHVVRVLEASADDGTTPYLAMERLSGMTLAEVLRHDGRLPASEVLELCKQVGAGIDAAAAAGIIHRDLKPQNLFKSTIGGDRWKILDFGVAALADSSGTLTQGGIVGTPSYMAPEQAQGLRLDARADVYAIAAVAYRCLTGRHPFTAPDTPSLLYAVVHTMPARPTALGAFDPDLDRWVALALAKAPDDRFPTGAAVAEALGQAIAGQLDPRVRKRADALIRERGWGTT